MIKNYFKIAWRNLLRNRIMSVINILGLATGMAFAILTALWIRHELGMNNFHKNLDRLAVIRKHGEYNNIKRTGNSTPLPLYSYLRTNYPEIKRISRVDWGNAHSLIYGDKKLNKAGFYVDPDFLEMFTFPLIEGNTKTALADPNAIVITESLAKALFGSTNPIGQTVKIDNRFNVKVTGILKDVPKNSTMQFGFLAPFAFKVNNFDWIKNAQDQWGNNFLRTYVEIREDASMDALSQKIGPVLMQQDPEILEQTIFLFPYKRWYLHFDFKDWVNTGGRIQYVQLFGIIGLFVLLIACINFMNLATARSAKRAREVGIRKAIGSQRKQLILQFLFESLLTTFIAFLVSVILVYILLPYLSDLGFEDIKPGFENIGILLTALGASILTGLLAGSYPAFYLSSFRPVKVLKGLFRQGKATLNLRKVLVVSQFVISVCLIICTVIVFQQIKHAMNRPTGYDRDNLISIGATPDLAKNFTVLKHDLLQTGQVEAVSKSSSPMTAIFNTWDNFTWQGKDPNLRTAFDVIMTDHDYQQTSGIEMKEGRFFSRDYPTDTFAIILNEAANQLMGFKDPIGKIVDLGDERFHVIGVAKNVVMTDPFKPVSPAVMLYRPENVSEILLRLKSTANVQQALAAIRPVVDRYNPAYPFDYSFVDDMYNDKFEPEQQVGSLAGIFAGLAIFISCLGLFGLSAFMAEQRTKEIGIRKVLGATVSNVWLLLSSEFVMLVLIACVIAAPVAWLLMGDWLSQYEYRITISWLVFLAAVIMALLIALATVSFQAIKAAVANPVKSLRTE